MQYDTIRVEGCEGTSNFHAPDRSNAYSNHGQIHRFLISTQVSVRFDCDLNDDYVPVYRQKGNQRKRGKEKKEKREEGEKRRRGKEKKRKRDRNKMINSVEYNTRKKEI